jgi:hypothetical protein
MNSESGDNRGTAGGGIAIRRVVVSTGLLVAGFLSGAALDATYRPNHIVFEVQPDTKVNLIPSRGDVIEWKSSNPQSTSTSIRFFSGKVPCAEANGSSQCTFTPLRLPQVYLYDCMLDQTPTTCYDPGMGPSSTSGGGHKTVLILQWIKDFILIVGVDLQRFLGIWPSPTTQYWMPAAGSALGSGAPAPAPGATNLPPRHINVAVDCDANGKAAVFPDGNPQDENHAITASVGDSITWQPYTAYSIGGLSACSPASLNGDPGDSTGTNHSCTITSGSGDVSYTVQANSCGNLASITEHITIQ